MSPHLQDIRWSVDWVRLVINLRTAGMTVKQIALEAGVSKAQVCAYSNHVMRQRPEHSAGERLIALWCARLGYNRDDLPMHQHPLSMAEILRASR